MPSQNRHRAWLSFVKKAAEVAASYSMEDLWNFRTIARLENPSFESIVVAYMDLAKRSETGIEPSLAPARRTKRNGAQMHLFDLLRERTFFPQNLDLARFAARVLPHMRTYRFDKMSRSDIAARIIEYLEDQPEKSVRDKLEDSMRGAMTEMKRKPAKEAERKSFLSKWEKIIKGIEL